MSRFSSRKFIVTMAVVAATTGLAVAGKMTGDVSTVLVVCVGAYNAANAVIRRADAAGPDR